MRATQSLNIFCPSYISFYLHAILSHSPCSLYSSLQAAAIHLSYRDGGDQALLLLLCRVDLATKGGLYLFFDFPHVSSFAFAYDRAHRMRSIDSILTIDVPGFTRSV